MKTRLDHMINCDVLRTTGTVGMTSHSRHKLYDFSAAFVMFIFRKISFMTSYYIFTTGRVMAINLLEGKKRSLEGNITSVCGVNLWKRRQPTPTKRGNSRTEPHSVTNCDDKILGFVAILNRTDEPVFSLEVTSRSEKYAKNVDKS
jgi:hypothetical protein